MLAAADACIAAQNAVTAAQSLGIGSCYIGDILENCEQHRALLHLPEYVVPAAMLVFGRPAPGQLSRPKPRRCEAKFLVHENSYRRMQADELRAMLGHKAAARPYEEWMRSFCDFKYNSGFSREMSRSAAEYLKAFEKGKDDWNGA